MSIMLMGLYVNHLIGSFHIVLKLLLENLKECEKI